MKNQKIDQDQLNAALALACAAMLVGIAKGICESARNSGMEVQMELDTLVTEVNSFIAVLTRAKRHPSNDGDTVLSV